MTAAPVADAPRRRKLWQLPTQAHELLLGTGFAPDVLRREAQRGLARIHRERCVLQGRDVDVLYAVVHDLATRNPLSEAFHKQLDARHAAWIGRLAPLRDPEALRAAWLQALAKDAVPAALWALLTHPLGASLETAALYDARAWVFTHVRRSVAQARAQQQAQAHEQALQQSVASLQARLLAEQQRSAAAMADAQAEIARLRGQLARAEALAEARNEARNEARAEAPAETPAPAPSPSSALAPAAPLPRPRAALTPPPPPPAPPAAPPRAGNPLVVRGRRVLCVGGIRHAVARYRGRIEQLGGQFEHHDGGIEDGVQALDARLGRAEVVICQAACLNHEAYQRVKRHCERTGKPCLYLERPSLSRLDRALSPAQDEPARPAL